MAQNVNASRPVTLAELNDRRFNKKAMVYHRASGADRDVIVLDSSATPADLTAAIVVLNSLYARLDSEPDRDIAAAVSVVPEFEDSPRTKLHAVFMQQLRAAKRRDVRGFGIVKAVSINVPAQSHKRKP